MTRAGLLLVNLGTPDAPTTRAVRRYLREFLMDPMVLGMPAPLRFLLVHAVIAPLRAPRSARAYRSIWTDAGSPLALHTEALRAGVARRLDGVPVAAAMRYGRPAIRDGLARLLSAGCRRVVVFPLYPQEAKSSSGTAVDAARRHLRDLDSGARLEVVPPFYDDPRFIAAIGAVARRALESFSPDHVLMSFHGLPESHVREAGDPGHCLASAACCDAIGARNARCYRAQCFATARAIAADLGLVDERYSVAFQSRLGPARWIGPFTDRRLAELARAGARRVAVLCPAFVADCLETLEEIGIRGRETFREHGGVDLRLVPGLNAEPEWVDACAGIAQDAIERGVEA